MGSKRSRLMRLGALVLLAFAFLARIAAAQCPDGTLPINGRCGGPRPVPALNPNRLAILPFRTSGADPSLAHLGNGLMELLSAEFNGELGPVAVEPGEALGAWARANAGPAPATQSAALRVARQLGAGQVAYSSIVGTARRFTVSISILKVPSGTVNVPQIQVQGTEDSLAALVGSLSVRLLGRSAGAISTSDTALRVFNAGMAAYRKGNELGAMAQLNRALELDSSFVLAAYRLVVLRALNGPSGPITPLALRTAWSERNRLSAEQRLLLEALIVGDEMLFRAQMLPRLERAMDGLPHSAEAWHVLGDLFFHVGALTGREDWADRARGAMTRAMALDSMIAVSSRNHSAELSFLAGDARTMRHAARTPWHRYLAALLSGDRGAIRTARIEYLRESIATVNAPWLGGITLPRGEVDSLLILGEALANTDDQKSQLARWTLEVTSRAGQYSRGAAARMRLFPSGEDSVVAAVRAAAHAEGLEFDLISAEWLSTRRGNAVSVTGAAACEIGLSRLRRSDTAGVAAMLSALPKWEVGRDLGEMRRGLGQGPRTTEQNRLTQERAAMLCREVLAGVLGSFDPSHGAALLRADSVMRFMPLNDGARWNYDLGLAFARRGDYAAAARPVRRRWLQPAVDDQPRLIIGLRQEGRWAALGGDTAAAIKAYKHYLVWRDDPEAPFIPQRDSVRAELAALEKAYRKPKAVSRPVRTPPAANGAAKESDGL